MKGRRSTWPLCSVSQTGRTIAIRPVDGYILGACEKTEIRQRHLEEIGGLTVDGAARGGDDAADD